MEEYVGILIFAGFGVAVLYLTNLQLHWWKYVSIAFSRIGAWLKRGAR